MRVKIFEGFGSDAAQTIEAKMNDWLAPSGTRLRRPDVIDTKIAATSVGPSEDLFQHIVVMVTYTGDEDL